MPSRRAAGWPTTASSGQALRLRRVACALRLGPSRRLVVSIRVVTKVVLSVLWGVVGGDSREAGRPLSSAAAGGAGRAARAAPPAPPRGGGGAGGRAPPRAGPGAPPPTGCPGRSPQGRWGVWGAGAPPGRSRVAAAERGSRSAALSRAERLR